MSILEKSRIKLWVFLCLLSMVWGVLSGLSFGVASFWLLPVVAIYGILAIVVLVTTMVMFHREHPITAASKST